MSPINDTITPMILIYSTHKTVDYKLY